VLDVVRTAIRACKGGSSTSERSCASALPEKGRDGTTDSGQRLAQGRRGGDCDDATLEEAPKAPRASMRSCLPAARTARSCMAGPRSTAAMKLHDGAKGEALPRSRNT
jgi:hypothetical protein